MVRVDAEGGLSNASSALSAGRAFRVPLRACPAQGTALIIGLEEAVIEKINVFQNEILGDGLCQLYLPPTSTNFAKFLAFRPNHSMALLRQSFT
jgi:hypothetical protein